MAPQLDHDDVAHLRRLPELLLRAGYVDAYAVYGVLHLRFPEMRKELGALPEALRNLVSVFLLGDPVERRALGEILGADTVDALLRLGVLVVAKGVVWTEGLILLPVLGQMVFLPAGQGLIGDAAVLAARISPPPGARCLDLCSGIGMMALRCLDVAQSVLAVEVNPLLVACIELSFALNGVGERAEVRQGDLYAALKPDERFDYVAANPPILAFPPHLLSPAANPDDDGFLLFRRVLQGLPQVLRPTGWAQILVCSVGDEGGPALRGELTRFARDHDAHVVMTLPARLRMREGDSLFEELARSSAAACGIDEGEVRQRLQVHLRATKLDYLYSAALTVHMDAARAGLVVIDHAREPGGFWFK
ncbi:MAG: methyltransferase [Deltaproteobacteria bacterium]|nr:methyltransferase [Deltaproteobacteria bacterium]